MTALLIVSADDFGLTDGVCRAVLRGHREGLVTATSLLAVGRSFDLAARMLVDHPGLDVGAHLAIVGEDPPLLTAAEIPTLVDRRGAFPLSYRTVVARGATGRLDPDDVRREFTAQLDRIAGAGVGVSHLDTHQHTHLWPSVAAVVVELAVERGVPGVRTPSSAGLLPVGAPVNLLSARLRRRIARAGLVTTTGYAGLDEAGAMDLLAFRAAVTGLTGSLPATGGSVEINTHPGEAGDPDLSRFDWGGYRWSDELDMLGDPVARALATSLGYRPGSFRDLTGGAAQ
ncbi:ChbG/HpnK family deacetylase [Nakamurella sp.]|uniref:ChbG/HpnK family deacetylase n=1 Tax=Nakamurella sp. TaxID=1869182 RepID=UPI0037841A7F